MSSLTLDERLAKVVEILKRHAFRSDSQKLQGQGDLYRDYVATVEEARERLKAEPAPPGLAEAAAFPEERCDQRAPLGGTARMVRCDKVRCHTGDHTWHAAATMDGQKVVTWPNFKEGGR